MDESMGFRFNCCAVDICGSVACLCDGDKAYAAEPLAVVAFSWQGIIVKKKYKRPTTGQVTFL